MMQLFTYVIFTFEELVNRQDVQNDSNNVYECLVNLAVAKM